MNDLKMFFVLAIAVVVVGLFVRMIIAAVRITRLVDCILIERARPGALPVAERSGDHWLIIDPDTGRRLATQRKQITMKEQA